MKTIMEGAVKKSFGKGPVSTPLMPKGPGPSAKSKMGIHPSRNPEAKPSRRPMTSKTGY